MRADMYSEVLPFFTEHKLQASVAFLISVAFCLLNMYGPFWELHVVFHS